MSPDDGSSSLRRVRGHYGLTRRSFARRVCALSVVFALLLSLAGAPLAAAGDTRGAAKTPTETTDGGLQQLAPRTVSLPSGIEPSRSAVVAPLATDTVFAHGFETWPGPWSISTPDPTWGQTSFDSSEGSYSAYCVGSTIPAPGPYIDDVWAYMIAGPFSLATYDEAELTFDMWLDSEANCDGLLVGGSTDGSTFALTGWTGYTATWAPMAVDMADFFGDGTVDFTGESQVWIAFIFDSDESVYEGYEGAYVDNVRVTATVAAPNTAPVAVADSYQTDEDMPLVRSAPGVLNNDSDADGDLLTASKVVGPSHGSVTLNSNGGFTYTPSAGYSGADSFTYRAYDGEAYSNTVSVSITVNEAEAPLPPVLNVAGDTRFETAVEASELAYPGGAETVVIATGRNWPDALGGSALAGALDAPILLTEPGSLPPAVAAEITRLKATHAVILGGTSAVATAVEDALKTTLTVERIKGTDRYDTANQVAARVKTEMGGAFDGTAFLATGGNFPDALAAAPLAAHNKWPLYLSHPTTGVSAATRAAMSGVTKVKILGGTAAISQAVQDGLVSSFSVSRIAGATRYDTAAQVAQYGVTSAGHMWNRVGIATGENYPDALAGGVLQGKAGSVMLLTPTASLCTEAGYKLLNNRGDISTVTFFGGTGAVSPATRTSVLSALAGTWTPPLPPPTGTGGLWEGYTTGYSDPVVLFNVQNGKITATGSTLQNGAAMIVVFPYSNVTMITYVYNDIPIGTDGKFAYTWGTVTTMGGQKWVNGTITSATHASGTATHSENSGYMGFTGNLTYDWVADR